MLVWKSLPLVLGKPHTLLGYKSSRSMHYNINNNNLPFEETDPIKDEKYKDLNNMYVDMFTETSNSILELDTTVEKTELEQLNDEFDSLTSPNSILNGDELHEIVSKPGRFIIESLSYDPYYNLALEDYIFRHTPYKGTNANFRSERLIFYLNDKCAVIGKNQVIWQELYLKELEKSGYEILRRLSGGGAVIHDLGNVNYSFITSRSNFVPKFFNGLIIRWLNSVEPGKYQLNARGDILYLNKKCSGSAYKISRGKAYHHGTMLINSELEKFSGLLRPKDESGIHWDSPSVESVRSSITNIGLQDVDEFIDICRKGFIKHYAQVDKNITTYYCHQTSTWNEDIESTMEKLRSHHWKFDMGPKFKLHLSKDKNKLFEVEHGTVVKSTEKAMQGKKFEPFARDLL